MVQIEEVQNLKNERKKRGNGFVSLGVHRMKQKKGTDHSQWSEEVK